MFNYPVHGTGRGWVFGTPQVASRVMISSQVSTNTRSLEWSVKELSEVFHNLISMFRLQTLQGKPFCKESGPNNWRCRNFRSTGTVHRNWGEPERAPPCHVNGGFSCMYVSIYLSMRTRVRRLRFVAHERLTKNTSSPCFCPWVRDV